VENLWGGSWGVKRPCERLPKSDRETIHRIIVDRQMLQCIYHTLCMIHTNDALCLVIFLSSRKNKYLRSFSVYWYQLVQHGESHVTQPRKKHARIARRPTTVVYFLHKERSRTETRRTKTLLPLFNTVLLFAAIT
jgi:hypothetical protein